MAIYLHTQCRGLNTGIGFIDATFIKVCHNKRVNRHKACKDSARRGKISTGRLYEFKLHLVVSDIREILSFQLTPGNVDDREPIPYLIRELSEFFGDKGYVSQKLAEKLLKENNVQLMTTLMVKHYVVKATFPFRFPVNDFWQDTPPWYWDTVRSSH
uniref:Transposase DDE domain-containing protein n=1 Tax=Candidatus Kentrum eta TaxID=2126337 RepID=A0A450V9S5_9GAMM|nr:MAG: Transposase DDE domain-containing protein [Candidatus Kentron sp. H]VFK01538.1 MAG: Transposase DDE domain-containing protein [Candidatus Kentron sp. H]VFK05065.1 MAG: Transposase DDE domain-containing protein [Candidatus Kentron sp. H]